MGTVVGVGVRVGVGVGVKVGVGVGFLVGVGVGLGEGSAVGVGSMVGVGVNSSAGVVGCLKRRKIAPKISAMIMTKPIITTIIIFWFLTFFGAGSLAGDSMTNDSGAGDS